jgi:DNA replication protein DnaC
MGVTSFGALVADLRHSAQQREEEHERKMRDDPAYRAEHKRREARDREREAAEKRRDEQRRHEAITKFRNEKGIPEKFQPYLDAWRSGPGAALPASVVTAHGWVERFLESKNAAWVFLFFAGPPGVGKTAAASWFIDAPRTGTQEDPFGGASVPVTREVPGRFVTAEELAKASTFNGEFWGECREAARLVIDDVGVETLDAKGWALGNLSSLLYHRHAHQLPTVITLNLNQQAFMERYASHDGGRLHDRLRESAMFVELTGPSLRRPLTLEDAA